MNRSLFLGAASLVRHLPNKPKKIRAVVAYRLAAHPCQGLALIPALGGSQLTVDLEDWTHRLYALGELDQINVAWLTRFIPPDGVFVDVGANIGLYTCPIARHLLNGGIVVAVEPLDRAVTLLNENIRLNKLENVEVIQAAASDSDGTLPLFEPPTEGHASSGHVRVSDPGAWRPLGSTPTIRLDDLLADRHVDAVKIDVEGHELRVLEGLASVLDRCRPVVLCEAIVPDVIEGLMTLRRSLGYTAFKDDGHGGLVINDGTPGEVLLVPAERLEALRPLVATRQA
jgi:FkbM family methyltransferase